MIFSPGQKVQWNMYNALLEAKWSILDQKILYIYVFSGELLLFWESQFSTLSARIKAQTTSRDKRIQLIHRFSVNCLSIHFSLIKGISAESFIIIIINIIIYPLTARVNGAPQMISPPFFPVLHCPLGLGELQACPFPGVLFPPLPLSALSSFPFYRAL